MILEPLTLPANAPVLTVTLTVSVRLSSGNSRLLGILHEYPQEPPQPYLILPCDRTLPAASVTWTMGACRLPWAVNEL